MTPTKNMAASVKSRLNNKAKETLKPADYYYLHYGIERFLYRLSQSEHANAFILKGALALRVHDPSFPRLTRDIDLLGFDDNNLASIEVMVRNVCGPPGEFDDGLEIDISSIQVEIIQAQKEYHGVRAKMIGYLERSRLPIQIDFGFGDPVHPEPEYLPYPVLLNDLPVPSVRTYPLATIFSEKIHAIVSLDLASGRLKDYYDIWHLSEHFTLHGITLCEAASKTFARRQTTIPTSITSTFLDEFATLNQRNWEAFQNRYQIDEPINRVLKRVEVIASPVLACASSQQPLNSTWIAGSGWSE